MTGKPPKSFHSGAGEYLQQKFQDENEPSEGNSNGSLVWLLFYIKIYFDYHHLKTL